ANIAYQTAYLKATYPAEYMAAMLSTQYDDTDKIIAATGECRRLGITVTMPDVNISEVGFIVERGSTANAASPLAENSEHPVFPSPPAPGGLVGESPPNSPGGLGGELPPNSMEGRVGGESQP